MKFSVIAKAIGIETYPEAMDAVFAQLPRDGAPACDLELIDQLQEAYDMFGQYYDLVRQTAQQINADEARSTWIKVAVRYAMDGDFNQARSIPVPVADGTIVTSMLPLYILIPQIPISIADYRRRGFSEEEMTDLISVYKRSIRTVESYTGLPGIDSLYYRWSSHFVKAMIFKTEGLQFELRTLPKMAVYLRNRESGKIVPIMCEGAYHASGIQRLGSKGYEDSQGSFEATFSEDAENYYGHGVVDCKVSVASEVFSKEKWECIVRPGDACLGMHIPRGADISVPAVDRAIASARRLVKERYPEFKGEKVFCNSWLLDPTLGEILGENSQITNFQRRFIRYPQKSNGMNVFGFVFPKNFESYETLPENTRLERGLKRLYLDGGHIYSYAGVMF